MVGKSVRRDAEWAAASLSSARESVRRIFDREGEILRILFVCTGNICRSPMAERLARMLAQQQRISELEISSVGTHALIGNPIHPAAVSILQHLGAEAGGFSATQLSLRAARQADLILTMSKLQRDTVLELAPSKLRHTFTLSEVAMIVTTYRPSAVGELSGLRCGVSQDQCEDIDDPYGQPTDVFDRVGRAILRKLLPIVELCALTVDN